MYRITNPPPIRYPVICENVSFHILANPNNTNPITYPSKLGKKEGNSLKGSNSKNAKPTMRTSIPVFAAQNCPIRNSNSSSLCNLTIFSMSAGTSLDSGVGV
jgi:hypothetical protein